MDSNLKITSDVSDINTKLTSVQKNLGLVQDAVATLPKGLQAVGNSFKSLGDEMRTAVTDTLAAVVSLNALKESFNLGASALKAESAFKSMADSSEVNADKLVANMSKAADGFVSDSHLMQKAAFAIGQDIDPEKISQLFEAARLAARKTGQDVTTSIDGMIQAISTNMPRSLRQMGMLTKEQTAILNKAVAAGIDDINLLDLVLANVAVDAAKFGDSADNAAKQLQRFQTQVTELKEAVGKGLIDGLQRLLGVLQGVSGFVLGAAINIFRLMEASNELMAIGADKVGATDTAAKWRAKSQYWADAAAAAEATSNDLYKNSMQNMYGGLEGGDKRSTEQKAADITDAEAERKKIIDDLKARIEAAKGSGNKLAGEWEKEWRALQADMAKSEGIDSLEKKLIDIDKKTEDLKAKFKEIPGADEKIESWASAAKDKGIEEAARSDFDEAQKREKEGRAAKIALDKELTAAEASELDKRLFQVDENAKKQHGLAVKAYADGAIDAQDYADRLLEIDRVVADEKMKLQDAHNKSVREAEINSRNAALDLSEKEGTAHKETINERIRLMRELKVIQEEFLGTLNKTEDPTAWYAQTNAINQTQKALADLSREAMKQNPFSALELSLKDTAEDLMNFYKNIDGIVKRTFSGMTEALTDFVMTGKANFSDLANSIIRDMVRMAIQQSITGPLASAAGTALSAIAIAIVGAMHTGGIAGDDKPSFYRVVPSPSFTGAPRFHAGIGPGERAAILQDGEGVFTPGQMRALGLMARQGQASEPPAGPRETISTPAQVNETHHHYATTIQLSIYAMDSRSVSQHLAQHKTEIIGMVQQAYNRIGQRGPYGS